MKKKLLAFTIRNNAADLFERIPKVVWKEKEYEIYLLNDFYNEYLKGTEEVPFDDFLRAVTIIPELCVFISPDPAHSLVSWKGKVDKGIAKKIIQSRNDKSQAVEWKKPLPGRNKTSDSQVKGKIDSPVKALTKKCVYDWLDSSEDGEVKKPGDFKGLSMGQPPNEADTPFEQAKCHILKSFKQSTVIPLVSFHAAMCQDGRSPFNYKTTPCNIPKHPHSSLSKFLACCKEIIELKSFRLAYAILKTPAAEELRKRRFLAFSVLFTDKKCFPLAVEVLLTTLFPVRTTLPLDDLTEIFKLVYGVAFDGIVGGPAISFLQRLASPNIILSQNGGVYNANVNSFYSDAYVPFGSAELRGRVHKIEERVTLGPVASGEAVAVITDTKSAEIFSVMDRDSGLINLTKIADMNLPKKVQELSAGEIPADLEYGPLWCFLRHSVNFDDEKVFFI